MCNEIIQAFLDLSIHFSRPILIEIITLMSDLHVSSYSSCVVKLCVLE